MARTFKAGFPGHCAECGGDYRIGTMIRKRLRGWGHDQCPTATGEGITSLGWGTLAQPSVVEHQPISTRRVLTEVRERGPRRG